MVNLPGPSDETVRKATGKGWEEWMRIIDDFGGRNMTHKQIARKLYDDKLVESSWWCQSVTVGYEYATGRRRVGETADQGFEVGVHKTVAAPIAAVWDFLLSLQGLKLWLGNVPELKLEKGYEYRTAEGTTGEVRTWQDQALIRMRWQPRHRKEFTTLQLRLDKAAGNKTRLSFHHEKLADSQEREEMRGHWRKILEKINKVLAASSRGE